MFALSIIVFINFVFREAQCTDDISCTFKDDYCGWSIRSTSGIGWERTEYKSLLPLSGPRQAYGNDKFYVYFDTLKNNNEGSQTTLASPALSNINRGCIRFYYHMYGENMGSLSFGTETSDTESEIWKESGNKGQSWLCKVATFKSEENDKVYFKATRGDGKYSIIALDNITLFTDFDRCTDCSDFTSTTETFSKAPQSGVTQTSSTEQRTISTETSTAGSPDTITGTVLYVICGVVGVAAIGIIILLVCLCRHRRKMEQARQRQDLDDRMANTKNTQKKPSLTPSEKYTNLPYGAGVYEELQKPENVYDFIPDGAVSDGNTSPREITPASPDDDYIVPSHTNGPTLDPERRASLENITPQRISSVSRNPRGDSTYLDYLKPI